MHYHAGYSGFPMAACNYDSFFVLGFIVNKFRERINGYFQRPGFDQLASDQVYVSKSNRFFDQSASFSIEIVTDRDESLCGPFQEFGTRNGSIGARVQVDGNAGGGYRTDENEFVRESPAVCHKFNVSLSVSFRHRTPEDLYDNRQWENVWRGLTAALPPPVPEAAYVFLGSNIEFLGFVESSNWQQSKLSDICAYEKKHFGVVCRLQRGEFAASASGIVQVMPLCGTRGFQRKAHAYIEGAL